MLHILRREVWRPGGHLGLQGGRKENNGGVKGIGEDGGAGDNGEIRESGDCRLQGTATQARAATSNFPVFNASRPDPQPSTTPSSHLCNPTCSPSSKLSSFQYPLSNFFTVKTTREVVGTACLLKVRTRGEPPCTQFWKSPKSWSRRHLWIYCNIC